MGVLTGCTPRQEVLERELDDAIFAADFGDLIDGVAPEVYRDAATFFRNTHPAEPLKRVVQAVFARLASASEGGATIRLSTGFGGGKTHTLMALWHLGENIGNSALGTELLPAAGRPSDIKVVAVDAGKAGVPIFGRHTDADGEVVVNSLWGELFYQLGGRRALATPKPHRPSATSTPRSPRPARC
jgi:predicted AAA+ superfamily ATPase